MNDYVAFFCSIRYSPRQIAVFLGKPIGSDTCSKNSLSSPDDLNYPLLFVSLSSDQSLVKHKRVVTNVGSNADAVYKVNVTTLASV